MLRHQSVVGKVQTESHRLVGNKQEGTTVLGHAQEEVEREGKNISIDRVWTTNQDTIGQLIVEQIR